MEVLVIGLDGADFAYFDRWAPDGLCRVPLTSQVGITGSEWMSIFTGIPVQQLGVYDYFNRSLEREGRPIHTYEQLEGRLWWEIAEAKDHRAAICAAPACYPLRPPALGWVLSGPGARDDGHCFASVDTRRYKPPAARNRNLAPDPFLAGCFTHLLGDLHEDRRCRLWRWCQHTGYDGICALAQSHGRELIEYYLENAHECAVGFVYFRLLDILLHTTGLTVSGGAIQAYQIIFDFVERLWRGLEPEHLFIVSDHGGQDHTHRDVGVFAWEPTRVTPARRGRSVLGNEAEEHNVFWLNRVEVRETPWALGTADVAELFLKPLGLKPKPLQSAPYSDIDEARVGQRLDALGYIAP